MGNVSHTDVNRIDNIRNLKYCFILLTHDDIPVWVRCSFSLTDVSHRFKGLSCMLHLYFQDIFLSFLSHLGYFPMSLCNHDSWMNLCAASVYAPPGQSINLSNFLFCRYVMMCIRNLIFIDNASRNIWLNVPVYTQMYCIFHKLMFR